MNYGAMGALPSQGRFSGSLPFEAVPAEVRGDAMHWEAPVSRLVDDIQAASAGPLPSNLCWHPERLVSAVLHSSQPDGPDRIRLVEDTSQFALEACMGVVDARRFADIRTRLERHGLMDTMVRHCYDPWSLAGTDPVLSRATADWILANASGPALIIPIADGGLPVASQVGAYLHQAGREDIVRYPVPFSRAKRFQRYPHSTATELAHLRELAPNRHVIVLDEDAKTGKTVQRTVEFLRRHGIVGLGLSAVVNHDQRKERHKMQQGEHWERA